jgi:hypothetical protein
LTALRSPLFSPLRSALRSPLAPRKGGGWSPAQLFQPGDLFLWYDPSDLSTMFQDTAGTVPVTADGQSVALIRDKGPGGYHRTQSSGPSMPKYKTSGGLHWLLYDGTDDSNLTSAINWGSDKNSFCMGVRKESDAAVGMIAEFSVSCNSNNGSFNFFAPGLNGTATFGNNLRGDTVESGYRVGSTFAAPFTCAFTSRLDIAGATLADEVRPFVNGVLSQTTAIAASTSGSGNFGNHVLYFGRRANLNVPFNGREFHSVFRNRAFSADEQAKIEAYTAAKCGITL